MSARAGGAEPLVITDLFQSRLDFAKKLVPGAKTLLVDRQWTPKEVAQKVKELAGMSLKLALECTGAENSIQSAIYVSYRTEIMMFVRILIALPLQSMQFGGKVFIIGVGKDEQLV